MFPITVAIAAPLTPISRARIIMGSSIMLTTVPMRLPIMEAFVAPSPLTILPNAVANIIKGAPKATYVRYSLA